MTKWSSMTKADLIEKAEELELPVSDSMLKADIIDMIESVTGSDEEEVVTSASVEPVSEFLEALADGKLHTKKQLMRKLNLTDAQFSDELRAHKGKVSVHINGPHIKVKLN